MYHRTVNIHTSKDEAMEQRMFHQIEEIIRHKSDQDSNLWRNKTWENIYLLSLACTEIAIYETMIKNYDK